MVLKEKKISGGKLVKIDYQIVDNIIKRFRLYGDFFLYPETSLIEMEAALIGKHPDQVQKTMQEILDKYHGQFIGVSPLDIQIILENEQLKM